MLGEINTLERKKILSWHEQGISPNRGDRLQDPIIDNVKGK
jgi:hypothetical protein